MFKVSPASLPTFIDTPNCVLKDRVQYSTVHIPNVFCDGHLQIINCVRIVRIHRVFHRTLEKKVGRRKIRRSWRPNGCRNDSVRKHVVQECHRHVPCTSRSAILLKVGLVNFIFFQLRNERIHNIVTVPLGVKRLREQKNGSDYAPTRHSNPNTNLLIMQLRLEEHMGIVCTPEACTVLYCNHQVHRDFLITLYYRLYIKRYNL
jgi:hypothetical protein